MRGRPRKPNWLKILEGNRGHRPITGEDFQPPGEAPEMPKGMSRAARREFRFMCDALVPRGGITALDGKALWAYCDCYAMAQDARRLIEKHGQLIPMLAVDRKTGKPKLGADGKPIIKRYYNNPAVKIHMKYLRLMEEYLKMFGLTPASRQKLFIPPKSDGK
jgi:P27 family predicted phage terminase small subunit